MRASGVPVTDRFVFDFLLHFSLHLLLRFGILVSITGFQYLLRTNSDIRQTEQINVRGRGNYIGHGVADTEVWLIAQNLSAPVDTPNSANLLVGTSPYRSGPPRSYLNGAFSDSTFQR